MDRRKNENMFRRNENDLKSFLDAARVRKKNGTLCAVDMSIKIV